MNIAILGFGSQGVSSLEYWNTPQNTVTICDGNDLLEVPDGVVARLGANYMSELDEFDLIVRSPSVHPRTIAEANSTETLKKVTTNTNEFLRICPTKKVIGVTGTKGKGTTSTLITRILEAAGHRVHLGGNIGTPPLQMLKDSIGSDDWVVLELANFQLIDIQYAPPIAVCVMVEPEHQDWHGGMDDYVTAKKQLFLHQNTGDRAIFYANNDLSRDIASAGPGTKIPYFAEPGATVLDGAIVIDGVRIITLEEITILGDHNWQNICAAVTAVWPIVKEVEPIRSAIIAFTGLPYRIEFRKEVNGVRFYNDSFATAPGASIAAIKAIREPKVMILGGYERGLPLDDIVTTITSDESIKHAVIIGESGQRLASALTEAGWTNFEVTEQTPMKEIVRLAVEHTEPGYAVVLSPAFASFDMFKNFVVRGNAFNDAVEEL